MGLGSLATPQPIERGREVAAAGKGRVAKGYKGIKIKCFVLILFSYSKLII
jgi:hypothetical protein